MRKSLLVLATVAAACSGAATQATTSTTQADPTSTTSPPPTSSASTSTTTTSSSTTTTTTTLAVPDDVAIIASLGAVMGVFDGEWVVIEDTEELPPVGHTWQIFTRPGQPIVSATGTLTGSNFYCDPAPYERPVVDFGGEWPWLAVQAGWPLVPHKVEDFTGQQAVYIDAVIEVLAGRGLSVDTANIEQLVRFDLEGDGVDEVIVVATEGDRADIYTPATDSPFEIVILRKLIEGEVWTVILELRLPDQILSEDGFPFLNEFEVIAIADLNGDGKMELAIRDAYYEGAGLVIWEFIDADLGFLPVLGIGCGA